MKHYGALELQTALSMLREVDRMVGDAGRFDPRPGMTPLADAHAILSAAVEELLLRRKQAEKAQEDRSLRR